MAHRPASGARAMRRLIRRVWRAAPVATVLLAVALAAAGYFGTRSVAAWIYWNDPAHRDQAIAGWMTPRYVAHSWNVPPEVVMQVVDRARDGDGPRSLDRIARDRGVPLAETILQLEAAIAAHRAAHPPGGADR